MDLSVLFLGTAASVPTAQRGTAGYLLRRAGDRILIDCGEGTQRQMLRSGVGLVDVDEILITHHHADHFLGLPGMLKTFGLRGRETPLRIYGPAGLRTLMEVLHPVVGRVPYKLELVEMDPADWIGHDGYRIECFATDHGAPSLGYAVLEDARPGRFDLEAARAPGRARGAGVRRSCSRASRSRWTTAGWSSPARWWARPGRAGGSSFRATPGRARPPSRPRRRPTCWCTRPPSWTRTPAAPARPATRTAAQAARMARDAQVTLLALTHLSTRYLVRDVRREAEAEFPNTVVPRDFDVLDLPLPERGAAGAGARRRGAGRARPGAGRSASVAE